MKKLTVILSAVMLVATLIFSACSAAPRTTVPTTTVPTYTPPRPTTLPTTTATPRPTYTTPVPIPTPTPTFTQPPATTIRPTTTSPYTQPPPITIPPPTGTIGLATGGAKDINNFRENIRNNYLPLPTDVSYEGLFYDYYFDTGMRGETNKLFCPSYSYAVTKDPLSNKTEYYMAVGLNSGMKEEDFSRKKLNLVIVLDSSGSMGSSYNQYYYDQFGVQRDIYTEDGINQATKMQSAADAVVSILNQLNSDDLFSIVTFNSTASMVKSMGLVRNTDMRSVRNKVLDIYAGGSTDLSAGMALGTEQFRNLWEINSYEYENRIIVLTDAQPNTGDTSSSGMMGMIKRNADSRIYTTVIGIGVDFNSQLIDEITKVKGANYYSVHSPKQFRDRVEEEFDFMVTPLIFNLRLNFESQGWRIEKVFGSPEANQATGELMKINTLFPSKSEGGQNKGGLVLLKLRKTSSYPNESIYLRVTYEDRNGRVDRSDQVITLEGTSPEYFDNSGIRKGILLSRYAALLKNWMIDERQHMQYSRPWDPCVREDTGILIPDESNLGQWERQSLPLMVSEPYKGIFRNFSRYFNAEMQAIKDYTMDPELEILNRLSR